MGQNGQETTTYSYDYLNILKRSTSGNRIIIYDHDENGNLINKSSNDGIINKEYKYDAENRLTQTREYSSSWKLLSRQDMKYNGKGQRVNKHSYTAAEGTKDNYYSYEGSSLFYATSQTNAGMDEADIIYFNSIGVAEDQINEGQWSYYGYTKDIRSSTRNLINSS